MKFWILASPADLQPTRELDSEKKLIRFLLREAENHDEFQLDWVQGPEDAEDLAAEMDLCEDGLELDYYSALVQTKEFPVLGILRYDVDAKMLKAEEVDWVQIAADFLGLTVRRIPE